MDKKEAKKEIYSFLRKEMNIPAKDIDKKNNKNVWVIDFDMFIIVISFDELSCKYYSTNIEIKQFKTEYKEIKTIKNNLEKIIKAIKLLEELI